MIKLAIVSLLFFISSTQAADPNYCESDGECSDYKVAHSFIEFDKLNKEQSRILLSSGIGPANFESWTLNNNDHAAAFLAITHAMSKIKIEIKNGVTMTADQMIVRINKFAGDRFFAQLNKGMFESWQDAKTPFELVSLNGKKESGEFEFHDGSAFGGSLHDGYDIQGFTSITKVPRLQINYRYSDSEADIDLDAYAPFIWGFIPNPKHLTYKNSDPRQWLDKLTKKYGPAGFQVSPSNH